MSRARNSTRPEGALSRRRRALTPLLLMALLGTAGCTSADPFSPGSTNESSSNNSEATPESEPVVTQTTIGFVDGKLPGKARTRLKSKIAEVVDEWFEAAYAGEYPRTDFTAAYPGFSEGAAQRAAEDAGLMSNADIGDRIDSVRFTKRRLRVDVLAVKRRAVGVTARFVLAQDTTGELEQSERIAGNLYLTYQPDGWKVFGYDAKRGVR